MFGYVYMWLHQQSKLTGLTLSDVVRKCIKGNTVGSIGGPERRGSPESGIRSTVDFIPQTSDMKRIVELVVLLRLKPDKALEAILTMHATIAVPHGENHE